MHEMEDATHREMVPKTEADSTFPSSELDITNHFGLVIFNSI